MTTIEQSSARIPLTATLAVAISAGVLFAIEPFAGKVLLPRMGGSPSVWNTCVMVFQALLLAGYGYSVLVTRIADVRKAAILHTALLGVAIVLWPLAIRALWLTPNSGWPPVVWVAATTVAAVGLPFALLSATSPLIQVWLARGSAAPLAVHRLYAASNLASVAGLIAYVALLEPFVGLRRQSLVLWAGFAGAMALAALIARGTLAAQAAPGTLHAAPPERVEAGTLAPGTSPSVWSWLAISFGMSLCLYAVNTYITTDVASFPLLWCLPLGIFLIGFALGFTAWAARWRVWLARVGQVAALGALAYVAWTEDARTVGVGLLAPLCALTVLITALATELAERRPENERLAGYYAWIGAGGVLAGITCVILLPWAWSSFSISEDLPALAGWFTRLQSWSPVLFAQAVPEYPAALILAVCLLAGRGATVAAWMWTMAVALGLAGVIVGIPWVPEWRHDASSRPARLFEARNFFGTSRVEFDGEVNRLKHGTTLHGIQQPGSDPTQPASYYGLWSPLGRVMDHLHPRSVIAVGLGVGTVAAYAHAGDRYRFLEINPLIESIARNPQWFSYLPAAEQRGVDVAVLHGDGRLLAETLDDRGWDLIIVDAFSSDAIPVHLLSKEAIELFTRKLTARGVIAYHVSNRFFDLHPVIAGTATGLGLWSAYMDTESFSNLDYGSKWIMLTRDRASGEAAGMTTLGWYQPETSNPPQPWTDDWSNVLSTLKSWKFWKGEIE